MTAAPDYLDVAAVADRIGVKRRTVYVYLSRGDMPEPDMVLLRHPLWLVTTIDEWRKQKGKRKGRAPRVPRRLRPPRPSPEHLWQRPPRVGPASTSSKGGASRRAAAKRAEEVAARESQISDDEARQLAVAVRQAGFHCTSADVHELVGRRRESDEPLEYERELLRQRIVAKRRSRE